MSLFLLNVTFEDAYAIFWKETYSHCLWLRHLTFKKFKSISFTCFSQCSYPYNKSIKCVLCGLVVSNNNYRIILISCSILIRFIYFCRLGFVCSACTMYFNCVTLFDRISGTGMCFMCVRSRAKKKKRFEFDATMKSNESSAVGV